MQINIIMIHIGYQIPPKKCQEKLLMKTKPTLLELPSQEDHCFGRGLVLPWVGKGRGRYI